MADVVVRVGDVEEIPVSIGGLGDTNIGIGDKEIIWRERESYKGPYSVTPTRAPQTLATEGKLMTMNVVVEAIPKNYGLITWDGSILTVS